MRLPWLAVALLALPCAAHAERYRVDLIVFADRSAAAGESPQPARAPEAGSAYELTDTARLRAAGIEILPDAAFALQAEWRKLKNSRLHEPLIRIAWLQKDPPAERGTGLRLRAGEAFAAAAATGSGAVSPVEGVVTLLAGRYLHLDADLAHTQRASSGELISYRLKERRRLRRNELHHLDSPRLGILVRVQKAEPAPAG